MPFEIREINYLQEKLHSDVIVVGGGVAGVIAAISARRNGAEVLLIDKNPSLSGLCSLYRGEDFSPEKEDRNMGGILNELIELSYRSGSPAEFQNAAYNLLRSEGIYICPDTLFSKTVMHGDYCEGIIVETWAGRELYTADMYIDATADAVVMRRSGAPILETEKPRVPSLPFMSNTRLTYCIKSLYNSDEGLPLRLEDSIGCYVNETNPELSFEIPYRALVSKETRNIIAAGRSINTSFLNNVAYSTYVSSITGQAAGTACALARELNTHIADLSVVLLQQRLRQSVSRLRINE